MGRRLGQHFLFDPSILDRIVGAIEPGPADLVLEIGPGRGTLTDRLLPRVGRVVALEKDPILAARLRERARGALEVVEGDALRLDWHALARDAGGARRPYKVVGNIPYYITSPLIEKALTSPMPEVVVFLMQREVAERLVASPGTREFGALTVGVGVAAEVERLFTVPAGAFRPPPRVESAVVRLRPRAVPLVTEREHPAFRRFVQAVFGKRRKQLGGILRGVADLGQDEVATRLSAMGIQPSARPETVPVPGFVELYRAFGVERAEGPRVDCDP